jgi:hypothetical protein
LKGRLSIELAENLEHNKANNEEIIEQKRISGGIENHLTVLNRELLQHKA